MPKNHTTPSAGHGHPALYPVRSFDLRLARIERAVNSIHKSLAEFRVSLEPLVPHIGAIEDELHDVRSSLDRIERAVLPPKRRASDSQATR